VATISGTTPFRNLLKQHQFPAQSPLAPLGERARVRGQASLPNVLSYRTPAQPLPASGRQPPKLASYESETSMTPGGSQITNHANSRIQIAESIEENPQVLLIAMSGLYQEK
jgi:hypothetical protein